MNRNQAVDAYRGFVMLLMMAEVLHLSRLAQANPDSALLAFLAFHQSHVPWAGCSLHDMIQPSFSFLVGVALPYSIAARLARGDSQSGTFLHALWRSFLLIALGIFLRSTHSTQTNFTFEDTLTQIGLGYPFLFLLGWRPPRWAWIALAVIPGATPASPSVPCPNSEGARRHPLRLLARLGHLSRPRSVGQESQLRPLLRRLVPQPIPARPAV